MKRTIILSLVLVIFTSCGWCSQRKNRAAKEAAMSEQPDLSADKAHNSRNSLDYGGTYEGTIPCADCPGIELTITLNYDGSYIQTMVYIDRPGVFTSEGVYEWDESGGRITLGDDQHKATYRVGENHLAMLDSSGNVITGELADMYVLKKR